jgi:hypothetical protein
VYDLSFQDLLEKKKNDLAIIALYNSESFYKFAQVKESKGCGRIVEVFEPK